MRVMTGADCRPALGRVGSPGAASKYLSFLHYIAQRHFVVRAEPYPRHLRDEMRRIVGQFLASAKIVSAIGAIQQILVSIPQFGPNPQFGVQAHDALDAVDRALEHLLVGQAASDERFDLFGRPLIPELAVVDAPIPPPLVAANYFAMLGDDQVGKLAVRWLGLGFTRAEAFLAGAINPFLNNLDILGPVVGFALSRRARLPGRRCPAESRAAAAQWRWCVGSREHTSSQAPWHLPSARFRAFACRSDP